VIADNDPEEQEDLKFSTLLTSVVIFHPSLDMRTTIPNWSLRDGRSRWRTWPCSRLVIQRFGVYATDEVALPPEPFDARLGFDLAAASCQHGIRAQCGMRVR
jgi:hypothetical protein